METRLRAVARENAQRLASLRKIFEEAGCSRDRLQEQKVKGSKLPNLICTLPGQTDSVILVGAHFDHVRQGDGAVDNWSGAALLPSLFESLRSKERKHTFIFVGFTDEEKGLVGSEYYAGRLTQEQASRISAMINLDSLGLSPTKIWLSRGDRKLAEALNGVAHAMKLELGLVNVDKVGSSDSESFLKGKIPAITIHSVTQESFPILHTEKDKLEALKLDDFYDTYRLLAAYLSFLDGSLAGGSNGQ
ncbi:MAG: M28 family metallopeptidase [Terriglobales bacterium]